MKENLELNKCTIMIVNCIMCSQFLFLKNDTGKQCFLSNQKKKQLPYSKYVYLGSTASRHYILKTTF